MKVQAHFLDYQPRSLLAWPPSISAEKSPSMVILMPRCLCGSSGENSKRLTVEGDTVRRDTLTCFHTHIDYFGGKPVG